MGQLGQLLSRAREARGLTLEDAERDTRISKRYLQALEQEDFEVIPAPVYARGFLRSYSQYLGVDPQEAILLFPRDGDEEAAQPPRRPTMQEPLSPQGPARPTWRRPGQQPPGAPNGRRGRAPNDDPVIGVDIGVPIPARRIKADPASQQRTATVALVAIGVVAAVLLFAFLISKLGGDGEGGPTGFASETPEGSATSATPTSEPTAAGNITGFVPDVLALDAVAARTELEAAGYNVNELQEASTQPIGTVIDQSPAATTELAPGSTVNIVLSSGP